MKDLQGDIAKIRNKQKQEQKEFRAEVLRLLNEINDKLENDK